ncbi:DUF423-domain-containing protein, partial [Ceraceosorus guamensis]
GAFGAHALRPHLNAHQQASWQTATIYHLVHSAALLITTTLPIAPSAALTTSAWSFATGITLFSGSIYGLCLTKEGHPSRKILGPATPLGGLAFIAGWVALAVAQRRGAPRLR